MRQCRVRRCMECRKPFKLHLFSNRALLNDWTPAALLPCGNGVNKDHLFASKDGIVSSSSDWWLYSFTMSKGEKWIFYWTDFFETLFRVTSYLKCFISGNKWTAINLQSWDFQPVIPTNRETDRQVERQTSKDAGNNKACYGSFQ